jgi:hypothetical protein
LWVVSFPRGDDANALATHSPSDHQNSSFAAHSEPNVAALIGRVGVNTDQAARCCDPIVVNRVKPSPVWVKVKLHGVLYAQSAVHATVVSCVAVRAWTRQPDYPMSLSIIASRDKRSKKLTAYRANPYLIWADARFY